MAIELRQDGQGIKKPRTSFGVNTSLKKDPLFKTSKRLSKITRIFAGEKNFGPDNFFLAKIVQKKRNLVQFF